MILIPAMGLVAGALFATSGLPVAVATIRAGKHLGTPVTVICAIFFGAVLMYAYLLATYGFDRILAISYGLEISTWGVLLFYWIRTRFPPLSSGDHDAIQKTTI